jgi:hypothetical protein
MLSCLLKWAETVCAPTPFIEAVANARATAHFNAESFNVAGLITCIDKPPVVQLLPSAHPRCIL